MKSLMILSVLIASSSAYAANDLYVTQASQKVNLAQQQVQAIEDAMPATELFLMKASLETLKMHLDSAQADLSTSLSPAPASTTVTH